MKFLKRHQIEDEKWNQCILQSPNGLIYGLSWFLDELTLNWCAFVVEKEDVYEAVFPVPYRRKFGVKYVFPPFFIQQLGLFSLDYSIENENRVISFLIQKFKFIELNLNYKAERGEVRKNLVLNLNIGYTDIQNSYSKNHIRNLKKSEKSGLKIIKNSSPEDIISLFRSDRGSNLKIYSDLDYENLLNLCEIAGNQKALMSLGVEQDSVLICGGVFMKFKNRIIFLFSGNSKVGKDTGALFFLLNTVIKMYANSGYVLDFEGSENEGLSRFYSGFGACEENYRFLKINNLPKVLKRIKK
ncbi:MAG: hypothetical protein CMP63_02690 [Flavobacteriales bacterium]|nr:hypothetical protein [Flavobacteriales bacterium]|tara:strand:- start:4004 stop:4900 length:897 start_codon:yes stop_codon:yes gene_type:complete